MKHSLLLIPFGVLGFFLPSSCSNTIEKIGKTDTIHAPQLIIGDPIGYSRDSLSIFPVGLSSYVPSETNPPGESRFKGNFGTYNKYNASVDFVMSDVSNAYSNSITTYTNTKTEDVDIRNLIFYNRFTGKSYKLTDEKLHVIAFSIHNEFKKPIIMYHVVKTDFNKDNKYNYNDPAILYISDLDGKNFTQLSPGDEQFQDYFFYKETNKMLLKVKSDSDSNRVFDPYDQCIYREVSLDKPAMGEVLFGEQTISDLKKLL